jgi:hypothetical protein
MQAVTRPIVLMSKGDGHIRVRERAGKIGMFVRTIIDIGVCV